MKITATKDGRLFVDIDGKKEEVFGIIFKNNPNSLMFPVSEEIEFELQLQLDTIPDPPASNTMIISGKNIVTPNSNINCGGDFILGDR